MRAKFVQEAKEGTKVEECCLDRLSVARVPF